MGGIGKRWQTCAWNATMCSERVEWGAVASGANKSVANLQLELVQGLQRN